MHEHTNTQQTLIQINDRENNAYTHVQTYTDTTIQLHKYTSIRIPNTHKYTYTNIQIYECTSLQSQNTKSTHTNIHIY